MPQMYNLRNLTKYSHAEESSKTLLEMPKDGSGHQIESAICTHDFPHQFPCQFQSDADIPSRQLTCTGVLEPESGLTVTMLTICVDPTLPVSVIGPPACESPIVRVRSSLVTVAKTRIP